jgi:hypothetical protein
VSANEVMCVCYRGIVSLDAYIHERIYANAFMHTYISVYMQTRVCTHAYKHMRIYSMACEIIEVLRVPPCNATCHATCGLVWGLGFRV